MNEALSKLRFLAIIVALFSYACAHRDTTITAGNPGPEQLQQQLQSRFAVGSEAILLASFLEANGFSCSVAAPAQFCWKSVAPHPYASVITDWKVVISQDGGRLRDFVVTKLATGT